jgi:UPF0716 protein FxsA
MYLLLALLIVPIVEIAVFIQVGGAIGVWPTIALVLLTAFAGIALVRAQGFATMHRARDSLARNEPPVREVFDGLCLVVAGLLLLVPGFVTDVLGLLLLVPMLRERLRVLLGRRIAGGSGMRVFMDGVEIRRHGRGERPGVIDGEFTEVREDPDPPPPDSRWRPPGTPKHPGSDR